MKRNFTMLQKWYLNCTVSFESYIALVWVKNRKTNMKNNLRGIE